LVSAAGGAKHKGLTPFTILVNGKEVKQDEVIEENTDLLHLFDFKEHLRPGIRPTNCRQRWAVRRRNRQQRRGEMSSDPARRTSPPLPLNCSRGRHRSTMVNSGGWTLRSKSNRTRNQAEERSEMIQRKITNLHRQLRSGRLYSSSVRAGKRCRNNSRSHQCARRKFGLQDPELWLKDIAGVPIQADGTQITPENPGKRQDGPLPPQWGVGPSPANKAPQGDAQGRVPLPAVYFAESRGYSSLMS
jgi:hypothetical protein